MALQASSCSALFKTVLPFPECQRPALDPLNRRLWSDEANRELVRDHYPWFLRTYNTLPLEIMRADAARCMYMVDTCLFQHWPACSSLDTLG